MDEWKECKLGDLADKIGMGPFGSNIKISTFVNEGIPVISGTHLRGERLEDKEYNFVTVEHANKLKSANVYRGDVIFTHAGNIGQVAFIPNNSKYERYILSQRQFYLRCKKDAVTPEYLTYYFKSYEGQYKLLANANQTGVPSLAQPVSYLKTIDILLPPLPEQRAIAGVLSSLDDKIDLLHRQNKTLEGMAEAVFRHWFIESLSPSREGFFGELIEITISGEWGKDVPEGDYNQRVYCVRGTDIDDLRFSIPRRIPERFIKSSKLEKILPKPGDLILEISGGTENQSTGRTICIDESIIQFFDAPVIYSNFCRLIRPKKKEYGCFLYLYCQWLYAQDEFFNLENGTSGIKNLDYINLLTTNKVNIPKDLGDIMIFESEIRASFQKIGLNRKQIHTLSRLRDTLLSKLMNGEMRVMA